MCRVQLSTCWNDCIVIHDVSCSNNLFSAVDGPSDGASLLIKHVIIKLQPAVLPPLAAAIVIFLISVCAACFCARKCSNHCALSKVVSCA